MDSKQVPAVDFLLRQSALICRSYTHWTGRRLLQEADADIASLLFDAGFAVLSHDTRPEPVFNYANRTAMRLFGMDWDEITRLPSRHRRNLCCKRSAPVFSSAWRSKVMSLITAAYASPETAPVS